MRHQNAAGQTLNFHDLDYDTASQITRITDIDGTHDYSYDDRDELTGANHTAPGGGDIPNLPDELYRYDANGNRLESHLHGTGYVTGPGNRLLSDGTYNYQYDNEGNTIKRTRITGAEPDGSTVREFAWDHRNRLIAVTDKTAAGVKTQEVKFTYDALDRRISKSVDTTPTDAIDAAVLHFINDREDVILDYADPDGRTCPNPPTLSQRYLHGPAIDQVLAQDNAAGTVHWHLTDHIGTISAVADEVGRAVSTAVFDSFGNVLGQPFIRYGFTGREYDSEIKVSFLRTRYYVPSVSRFASVDAVGFLGGDANLYRYVRNQPVLLTDLSGLTPQCPATAQQCRNDARFRPYSGVPLLFHCGYEGFVEDRTPDPSNPQAECFYDKIGGSVEGGCGGSSNDFDAKNDPWKHTFYDRGGPLWPGSWLKTLRSVLTSLYSLVVDDAY
jgi:RHS repeat-associated protein